VTSHSAGSRRRALRRPSSRGQRARRLAVSLAIVVAAVGVYVFVLTRGAIL
jgi:hypothetical protein